jgi:hypothetical protein
MRTPAAGATGDVTAGVAAICPRTVVDCTRVLCARRTSDAVLRRAWPHLDGILTVIPPAAGHSAGLVTGEPLATIASRVVRTQTTAGFLNRRVPDTSKPKRNSGWSVRPGQRGEREPYAGPVLCRGAAYSVPRSPPAARGAYGDSDGTIVGPHVGRT